MCLALLACSSALQGKTGGGSAALLALLLNAVTVASSATARLSVAVGGGANNGLHVSGPLGSRRTGSEVAWISSRVTGVSQSCTKSCCVLELVWSDMKLGPVAIGALYMRRAVRRGETLAIG